MNKVVPVVSSVGVALLSVYVLVKAFRLVSGFVAGR
ncbi:major capsid protein [Neisseria meningitidis]